MYTKVRRAYGNLFSPSNMLFLGIKHQTWWQKPSPTKPCQRPEDAYFSWLWKPLKVSQAGAS